MTLTELKAKAAELGLSADDVRQYGSLIKKATWEAAISNVEQLVTSNQSVVTSSELPDVQPEEDKESPTPPNPEDFQTFEEFNTTYNQYLEALWQGDDDIAQSEEQFTNARELWEQQEVFCPQCDGEGAYLGDSETWISCCDFCNGKKKIPLYQAEEWKEHESDNDYLMSASPIEPVPQNQETIDWRSRSVTAINLSTEIPSKLIALTEDSPQSLRDELAQKMALYVGTVIPVDEFEQLQNEPLDEPTAAILLGWLAASEQLEAVA